MVLPSGAASRPRRPAGRRGVVLDALTDAGGRGQSRRPPAVRKASGCPATGHFHSEQRFVLLRCLDAACFCGVAYAGCDCLLMSCELKNHWLIHLRSRGFDDIGAESNLSKRPAGSLSRSSHEVRDVVWGTFFRKASVWVGWVVIGDQ